MLSGSMATVDSPQDAKTLLAVQLLLPSSAHLRSVRYCTARSCCAFAFLACAASYVTTRPIWAFRRRSEGPLDIYVKPGAPASNNAWLAAEDSA